MTDLSVIIVNWNTAALLMDCLESVFRNSDGISSEIVVVDNGSTDGSVEAVRRNFPAVNIIQNSENFGFAKANNQALKICAARYAVLLNTDARLEPGALATFLAFMDREKDVAACCGQLLDSDGTTQNSFSVFPSLATELLNKSLLKLLLPRWYPSKWGPFAQPVRIDSVIGACMAIRTADLGTVGLLDEDYFFFFEETDWCRRAQGAGKRIVFIPSARITHMQGQSVSRDPVGSSIEYYRSRYTYFRKHHPLPVRFLLRVGLMFKLVADILLNCLGLIATLGMSARYRSKFKIFTGIILWHIKLWPAKEGLKRAQRRKGVIPFENGKWMLSVCIIVYNEERNIGACLESVKWADEIVVLDSYSGDRTVETARRYTDKVFQAPWEGFSRNKNLCVGKATHEWILVVDADERMTPELKNEICSLSEGVDGYYVGRKNFFLGKWIRFCGWFPDYSIRLFRKSKGTFGDRAVHEAVRIDGKTAKLSQPLLHYTYTSVHQFVDRLNRYSTLAAEEIMKKRGMMTGRRLRWDTAVDLLTRPAFTFIKMYFVKLGFLDGKYGFLISFFYSYYVFMKYAKKWEISQKERDVAAQP
jgi:hypothetical protein